MNLKKILNVNLIPIYGHGLNNGNCVSRIDQPAGTKCPLAVIFQNPLQIDKINKLIVSHTNLEFWENTDPHYPFESGYYCKTTQYVIAGPVSNRKQ